MTPSRPGRPRNWHPDPDDASHPDHPDYMHPDAPQLPKRIMLHRADAVGPKEFQSVIVEPEHFDGHSTAHKPGPTAGHALKAGLVPDGYVLQTKSGKKLHGDHDLYDEVKEGDVVEVVKA